MQCSKSAPATSRSDKRKTNSATAGDGSRLRDLKNDDRHKQPMAIFELISLSFLIRKQDWKPRPFG
jgi:hypothetical protein